MSNVFGIINLTHDSFSGDGTLDLKVIEKYIQDVANFGFYGVDVGAVSTRPNALLVTQEDELRIITNYLPKIIELTSRHKLKIALDSFRPEVVKFGLSCGIDYINDVTGFENNAMIDLVLISPHVKCICMHSLGVPNMSDNIVSADVNIIDFITDWAKYKIQNLTQHGISKDRIVIDLGVGFGKSAPQSLELIANLAKIKQSIDAKIYIGHSRKSFLRSVAADDMLDRDVATSIISSNLFKQNCDYIRVHNLYYTSLALKLSDLF